MQRDERSPMGCSAAMLVDCAPYNDSDAPPAEDKRLRRAAAPAKPKASDRVPDRTCPRCGLIVAPAFGEHRNALDCVDALRDCIAMERWQHPIRLGRKKRVAAG